MVTSNERESFWFKANENLVCVQSEYESGRYDSCASRYYYATYQAAVVALLDAGIVARGGSWSHEYVQSQFAGPLITRRKVFAGDFRNVLSDLLELRLKADYRAALVSRREASDAVAQAQRFMASVEAKHGSTA